MGQGGFPNIFQSTRGEDLRVKMMEDKWEKKAPNKVSGANVFKALQRSLLKGQIYGFPPRWDVWLGLPLCSIHERAHLPTKLFNNIY